MKLSTQQIIETNALACLECGKCTGVCPVSRFDRQFSPRRLLMQSVRDDSGELLADYDLWSCLTCKRCDAVCPSDIKYSDLTRFVRNCAADSGFHGKCSHSGAMDMLQKIMTKQELNQNRLDWVGKDLNISQTGEYLYFVGCAPYFDVFFDNLNLNILASARSSIKILNRLGISPVLMPDERCCGHDLLWNGDFEQFKVLAETNLNLIQETEAKTILFSCAECMSAFENLYPAAGLNTGLKLQHMSQFLAEKIKAGDLSLKKSSDNITYQDPCRLGRHLKETQAPRIVLNNGGTFHEMKQNGKGSLCCGVSAWMNCDITSKRIQTERLKQASETGADILVVACPKCQIHLECTKKDQIVKNNYGITIKDIAEITLERME